LTRPFGLVVLLLLGEFVGAPSAPAQVPGRAAPVVERSERPGVVPLVLLRRSRKKAPDGSGDDVLVVADPSNDPMARRAAAVMSAPDGFGQFALRLDRFARTYLRHDPSVPAARKATLAQPAFLFLSDREGGFPADSFWLERTDGTLQAMKDVTFVDMVVTERDFAPNAIDGLQEIYAHELGHLMMAALAGPAPAKASSVVHFITVRTDGWYAFIEGWGEHFQPVGLDYAARPAKRSLAMPPPSARERLWYSRFAREQIEGCVICPANLRFLSWQGAGEQRQRDAPLRANAFVHDVELPEVLRGDRRPADEVRMYRDVMPPSETAPLRNGPQMMASEGVIGTLFYRLVTDARLQNGYRDAAFYEPFLADGDGRSPEAMRSGAPVNPRDRITPLENAYLKLFDVMHRSFTWTDWPTIALVSAYARQFPDEAPIVYEIFLDVTRGVTVERAARTRHTEPGYLDGLKDRLLAGDLALDAALGRPLWMVSSMSFGMGLFRYFAIPNNFTFDVNAADVADLRSVSGVSADLAAAIVRTRDERGSFATVDALSSVSGMTPELVSRFKEMEARMTARRARVKQQGSDPAWAKSLLAPALRGSYYAAGAWQFGKAAVASGLTFGATMLAVGWLRPRSASNDRSPKRRWWRRMGRSALVCFAVASGPCAASAWLYSLDVMPTPWIMAGVGIVWGLLGAGVLTATGRLPRGNVRALGRVAAALTLASAVVGFMY
jgi:hypothetical protein